MIGVPANPASAYASIDLLFAEADQFGDAAVFGGTGTVSSDSLTGNSEFPSLLRSQWHFFRNAMNGTADITRFLLSAQSVSGQ